DTPLLVRLAVVSAISAMTLGLLPGAGQATPVQPVTAPKTASEAAQKVQQLGDQLEVLSEEVNGARIRVAKLQQTALAATRQAKVADQQYPTLSVEVAKIVRTTYQSAPFG